MSLWMQEVNPREPEVAALSGAARREIAYRAMTRSLEFARPGAGQWIQPGTLAYLDRVLSDYAAARPADDVLEALGEEMNVLEERDVATGAALLSAAWIYIARQSDDLDEDDTMAVLLSSYEAVLHTRQLGRIVTTEMEQADPACAAAIAFQLELIEA
jgi:hypothetical protein